MASALESQIRKQIGAGFKNRLLKGTITRPTATTVNSYGDDVPSTALVYVAEGIVDNYSDEYRVRAGIPEGDSKVLLILANCGTEPKKDDILALVGFPAMKVRKVMIDPARASAECQSFAV